MDASIIYNGVEIVKGEGWRIALIARVSGANALGGRGQGSGIRGNYGQLRNTINCVLT